MRGEIVILLTSVVAGVLGTGIGGVLGAAAKDKSRKSVGGMLAFAGGVMLGVTAFEMLPDAVKECLALGTEFLSALAVAGAVFLGVFIAFAFKFAIEKIEEKRKNMPLDNRKPQRTGFSNADVEVFAKKTNSGLKRAGIITFFAIAFHNIPEGMAIGASGASSLATGVMVAIVIALHNLPEGMAISAPLVSGGVKPYRAILLSICAGCATLLGAVVGVFVGGLDEIASGVCVAIASGAMIYVSCFDLLPVATKLDEEFPSVPFVFGGAVAMIFSLLF